MMVTMLARTILISVLLFSTAYAQPAPSPQVSSELPPIFVPEPTTLPVPANGCVWAGRSFSEGAGFCIADKVMQVCTAGKWGREGASEGCRGALADSK
jgi:hypothetical protein